MDTYCKTEEMITKYAKLYKIGQLVHERTQWGHIYCSLLWKLNKVRGSTDSERNLQRRWNQLYIAAHRMGNFWRTHHYNEKPDARVKGF